jgi:hypothetical protein
VCIYTSQLRLELRRFEKLYRKAEILMLLWPQHESTASDTIDLHAIDRRIERRQSHTWAVHDQQTLNVACVDGKLSRKFA